jgi:hypothetical protein
MYLVEEVTSGLVDGFYVDKKDAINYASRHKLTNPNCLFVITKHEKSYNLHDSQMLKYADWFNKASGGSVCFS